MPNVKATYQHSVENDKTFAEFVINYIYSRYNNSN